MTTPNTTKVTKALAVVLTGAILAFAGAGCGSGDCPETDCGADSTGQATTDQGDGPVGTACQTWMSQDADQQKGDATALVTNNGSANPTDAEITLSRLAISVMCSNTQDQKAVIDDVYDWALEALGDQAAAPKPPPDGTLTNDPFPGATADGGIQLGQDLKPGGSVPDDVVRVDIVFDYICPVCKHLEDLIGADLRAAAQDGQIMLVMHPLGYLDVYSTTEYSTRAANAAVTIAARAPEQFVAFDLLMWEHQPDEGGAGLSDSEIADLAKQAGVDDAVIAELTARPFGEWVTSATQLNQNRDGFQGTPMALMSYGEEQYTFSWSQGNVREAIANVKAGKAP